MTTKHTWPKLHNAAWPGLVGKEQQQVHHLRLEANLGVIPVQATACALHFT